MRAAMVLSGLAGVAMFALIGHAISLGSFREDGSVLLALVWGRVTLADLYVGFALFSSWVVFREASALRALVVVGLVLTLGNAFAALYVLLALVKSRGSWPRFWLGHRFTMAAGVVAATLLAAHAGRADSNAGFSQASLSTSRALVSFRSLRLTRGARGRTSSRSAPTARGSR
jgi:hypothetical protein